MILPALLLSLLPLGFEPNQGQADPSVRFVAHSRDHTLLLDARGAAVGPGMRLRLLGANPSPRAEAVDPLPGKSHYLIPGNWHTNVTTYRQVIFHEVYPGIDLVWYGREGELEYDFRLRAGAGASRITLEISGARMKPPLAFQEGRRIACRYVRRGRTVRFALGGYDHSRPLVIDPVVIYSTYLGGSGNDNAAAVAVDRWGATYVAGETQSSDFPVSAGAVQSRFGGGRCPAFRSSFHPCLDAFVTKINPSGSAVVWSTYLGGSSDDGARALAVDDDGNVYLAGFTSSTTDFPLVNPLFKQGQTFVAKLSADGSTLIYSTLIGPAAASVSAIAADHGGNLYLTGTAGGGWPTVNPAQVYNLGAALYKTSNRGATWLPVYRAGSSVGRILLDPRQPSTIYVSGSSYLKSIDGGATWQVLEAGVLAVDPTNSSVLYGIGPYSPQKSEDGGRSWRPINNGLAMPSQVNTIIVDPKSPSTVYAATSMNGVYKSTDGGNSWLATGLQPAGIQDLSGRVFSLAIDPKIPSTVYAGTMAGIYKTIDAGATWKVMNSGVSGGTGPWFLAIDPATPSTVYAAAMSGPPPGVFRTTDGGQTWRPAATGLPMGQLLGLALNPLQPSHLALATGVGPYLSTDGGETWAPVGGQLPYGTSSVAIEPTTETVYTGLYRAGDEDAFVAKLNPAGTALLYSTYLGGSGIDSATGISVDDAGRAYIIGSTNSPDFPTVNAVQPRKALSTDGFAAVLSPEGSKLLFSTYFQGGLRTSAIDRAGNLYLARTADNRSFLVKLDPTAPKLLYSFAFDNPLPAALAVDAAGNAYVGGTATADACRPLPGVTSGQVFKLDSTGSLLWSVCLAGTDSATALALDRSGNVVVTGHTGSLPLQTIDPLQRDYHGGGDSYLIKLAETAPPAALRLDAVVNAASYQPGGAAPGGIVSLFGAGLATGTARALTTPLPTAILTRVTFNGIPAPLYFVSPTQINAQVPFEIGAGPVIVEVTPGSAGTSRTIDVVDVGPGLFSINAQGTGPGAILHGSDFKLVTDANPARPAEIVAIYATGLGRLTEAVASGAKPAEPPPQTAVQPQVRIAGRPAEVLWSGAAPGFVGLYQVNVRVPDAVPSGAQPVQLGESNTVTIAIR